MFFKKRSVYLYIILSLLVACTKTESAYIQDFSFINQDGETFSYEDVSGDFWIAAFIYTNCRTVCTSMTQNKALLQKELKQKGLTNIPIVSFTVDPDQDSPDVLKQFGKKNNIEFDNVHFLTGYTFKEIEQFSLKSFQTPITKEQNPSQISHTINFFLISPEGKVVEKYDGTDPNSVEQMVKTLKKHF